MLHYDYSFENYKCDYYIIPIVFLEDSIHRERRMVRFFKSKLKTTKKTSQALKSFAGAYRKIWNYAMDYQNCWLGLSRSEKLHYMKTAQLYEALIKGRETIYPFVRQMDGGMIKAVSLKANESFKRWFDNYPLNTKFRRSRYLSRKKDLMSFKTQGNVRIFEDYIEIPKLGKVKLYEKNYLPIGESYSNMTFSYDGNNWWISFEVKNKEEKIKPSDLSGETVLDFNKQGDITVGTKIFHSAVNEKSYKRAEKKQRKLTKKLKRQSISNIQYSERGAKTRTSRNMLKTQKQLAKIKVRLNNIRQDNFKKQACALARTKLAKLHCLSTIAIKQSKQGGLTRIMREKHTLDFLNIIRKKIENSGAEIVFHNLPDFSSLPKS